MKFRVGACALLVCLAGCTGEGPNSDLAELRGAAATKSAVAQIAKPQLGRSAAESIANAPDRGALMSYKNKGAASKREGAFTLYPVAISEEHALKAVVTGEITVPAPDGSQVKLRYERHEEHPDGNWTWIGRVEGGNPLQEAIITFGEKAVFASIPQVNGQSFEIETRNGALYAVQVDRSKVKSGNTGHTDMLVPEASAIRDAAAKMQAGAQAQTQAQVAQAAVAQGAPATSANTVDVAIGYTPAFRARFGSQSAAATRLTQLISIANQGLANSKINGYLRLVAAVEVAYVENNTNQAALRELTGNTGTAPVTVPASLVPLRTARDQYGADIALLVRNFQRPEHEGCGIAWLNGANRQEIVPATDAAWAYAVISDGWDENYFCADETLAHESAHLMGSAHDVDNSKNENGSLLYGRYDYSFGYKAGTFFTIMAYGDDETQTAVRMFSNPTITTCGTGTSACGVANQADNARSLNQTIPVVARFRATVVPFLSGLNNDYNGDGRSDIFWRHSQTNNNSIWFAASPTGSYSTNTASNWKVVGTGDFNGDGKSDLLWRSTTGTNSIWWGAATTSRTNSSVGVAWQVAGVADFNGDGKADIFWRNPSNGSNTVWWSGSAAGGTKSTTATDWTVVGTGDFNGDGRSDVLWRRLATGTNSIWFSAASSGSRSSTAATNWQVAGTGDFNGDGRFDILWRNTAGGNSIWWAGVPAGATSSLLSTSWRLETTGDYDGDGSWDFFWRNANTGQNLIWRSGSAATTQAVSTVADQRWAIYP
jgi:peptidyl-Asp metalloendopeptidase